MNTIQNYYQKSMFSSPAWRWDRVLALCERTPTPGRCTKRDDFFVRQSRQFLLRWRAAEPNTYRREELFWGNEGLYFAHEIHERSNDEPEVALTLQARILARQTSAEISKACGLPVEAVDWYESMFFCVRDRIDHRDWITKQVLVPATMRNVSVSDRGVTLARPDGPETPFALPFYDVTTKLFAYFGGPILLDFMLSGFHHGQRVTDPKEVEMFLDKYMTSSLRRRTAMATTSFDINQYNVMQLFELTGQLIKLERELESGQTAKSSIETHIVAMLNEMPWMCSKASATPLEGRQKGRGVSGFDVGAVELRDDELILDSSDSLPENLKGLEKFELPKSTVLRRRKVEVAVPGSLDKKSGD
jgi:hypothetical protein